MSGMEHLTSPVGIFKCVYSVALLIFSIVIIMGLINGEMTTMSSDASPVAAYITIWVAIIWLSMVEGGQGSLVGLAPVDAELYKESHPRAYRICSFAHVGDNLDRYLLGRQFMVVLVVFTVNMAGAPIEGAELWGLPKIVIDIFLGSGLAMILFTCMVGQLNSQVNASHCMLDYINNFFAQFTFWVAMAIEFSGLLHASYVLQKLVSFLSGKKIESTEPPRNALQSIFFWGRCLISLAILGFCFAVTLTALFDGKTTIWDGVPPGASLVIFFFLMSIVGMLEGMQIAFFAVAKLPASERGESTFAKKTCDLLFKGKGNNLPGFMIGRQLCVVSCMFFIARVTSVKIEEGEENIFGVGSGLQELFNTGLLGALIVTIVASIAWQLVASAFPLAFLANPITYFLLVLCLGLEGTGICNGAWVLAVINRNVAGWKRDEEYIGTAEERAKQNHADNVDNLPVGPGHILKLPVFMEHAPDALKQLLKKDPSVRKFVNDVLSASQAGSEAESIQLVEEAFAEQLKEITDKEKVENKV